jgi:hypothetical protein
MIVSVRWPRARKGRCRQQRAAAKHDVAAVDFIEVIERTGLVVLIRSVVAHRDRLLRLTGISEWLCAAPISLHLSQDKGISLSGDKALRSSASMHPAGHFVG